MAKSTSYGNINTTTNTGDAIVLNRMYVGDYLSHNLGHEVINMFQADNGKHYLYLNAYGAFARERKNKNRYMLLTKYHSKDCIEVIGKAVNLTDLFDYEKDGNNRRSGTNEISENQQKIIKNISYGKVSLEKLFSDAERQSVYVTFEAEKIYRTTDWRILIHYVPQKSVLNAEEKIKLEGKLQKQSILGEIITEVRKEKYGTKKKKVREVEKYIFEPKQSAIFEENKLRKQIDIYLSDSKLALASLNQFIEDTDSKDYNNVIQLFDAKYDFLWTEVSQVNLPENFKPRELSLFDICQIQNSENRFSNALEYFMTRPEYKKLWNDFFSLFRITLGDKFSVTREELAKIEDNEYNKKNPTGGRIDLMIRTSKAMIIIENKVKSDINSIEDDGDGAQLLRYYNYAEYIATNEKSKGEEKSRHYLVLSPKYNIPEIKNDDMKKAYKFRTYKDLYDFLEKNKSVFEHDANFVAFFEAIKRHTYENVNDYLYYDMQEKFFRRISEFNKTK